MDEAPPSQCRVLSRRPRGPGRRGAAGRSSAAGETLSSQATGDTQER